MGHLALQALQGQFQLQPLWCLPPLRGGRGAFQRCVEAGGTLEGHGTSARMIHGRDFKSRSEMI